MICPNCGGNTSNAEICVFCGKPTEFARKSNFQTTGTSRNAVEIPSLRRSAPSVNDEKKKQEPTPSMESMISQATTVLERRPIPVPEVPPQDPEPAYKTFVQEEIPPVWAGAPAAGKPAAPAVSEPVPAKQAASAGKNAAAPSAKGKRAKDRRTRRQKDLTTLIWVIFILVVVLIGSVACLIYVSIDRELPPVQKSAGTVVQQLPAASEPAANSGPDALVAETQAAPAEKGRSAAGKAIPPFSIVFELNYPESLIQSHIDGEIESLDESGIEAIHTGDKVPLPQRSQFETSRGTWVFIGWGETPESTVATVRSESYTDEIPEEGGELFGVWKLVP